MTPTLQPVRQEAQLCVRAGLVEQLGLQGHASLVGRLEGVHPVPDDDKEKTIMPFKSGARAEIENTGYAIIANVGDQRSDLEGGHAECTFKVPNPYYVIP
jgi:hypothetical protein